MWDANLPDLVAEGVTHFSTGATFETTFGGQRDFDTRLRLLKNVRQSLLGPWATGPATPQQMDDLIDKMTHHARKRARSYNVLLAEPFRSLIIDSLPAIRREVTERLTAIAAAGPISIEQVRERFESCLLYTSPSPRDRTRSRMPSSA